MIAKSLKDNNVFGYDLETAQDENKSDVKELEPKSIIKKIVYPTQPIKSMSGK
nr:hypothetical protein [uncultured Desulfobacter sp.]